MLPPKAHIAHADVYVDMYDIGNHCWKATCTVPRYSIILVYAILMHYPPAALRNQMKL